MEKGRPPVSIWQWKPCELCVRKALPDNAIQIAYGGAAVEGRGTELQRGAGRDGASVSNGERGVS